MRHKKSTRRLRRKMRRTRRQRGGEFESEQASLRKHITDKFPMRPPYNWL